VDRRGSRESFIPTGGYSAKRESPGRKEGTGKGRKEGAGLHGKISNAGGKRDTEGIAFGVNICGGGRLAGSEEKKPHVSSRPKDLLTIRKKGGVEKRLGKKVRERKKPI